jgi:predicted ArsR family transcriptional regulator
MIVDQESSLSSMRVERKEQGATRQNILHLLRRHGQMTAIELSEALNIGAVGVRQHLALLERDGLVKVSGLRRSVGRPSHLYTLTSESEHYFPKNYDRLANDMLSLIQDTWGEEAVEHVLVARREKMARNYKPRLEGKNREEQIAELCAILSEVGYMCEYERGDNGCFVLVEHNCPIDCVARCHPQFCEHEIKLYEELLGVNITRDATIVEGGLCCRYYIPA